MKTYQVKIENYKAIESMTLDLNPGVQGFVGENAQGKTSILDAVQALASPKADPEAVRDGAEKAILRLEIFEDGKPVAVIARTTTAKGSKLEAKGLPMGFTPAAYLAKLLDERMLNPIRLISEDPVNYLKQHLDVALDPAEIPAIVGQVGFASIEPNPFHWLDQAAKHVAAIRLERGRAIKEKQGALADLRAGLKPLPQIGLRTREDVLAEIGNLQGDLGAIKEKKAYRLVQEDKLRSLKGFMRSQAAKVEQLEGEIANMERLIAESRARKAEILASVRPVEIQVREIEVAINDPIPSSDAVENEILKRQAEIVGFDEIAAIEQRHKIVAARERDLSTAVAEHKGLDAAYKALSYEIPAKLIQRADLGVPGLEFRDGVMYAGSRRVDLLSETERAIVATKIAIALAKRKGHLCISLDGIEIMDDEHRKAWLDLVKDSGLRVFYTRRGKVEGEHEVEIVGGRPA
jgi:hypothetical protein